MKLGYSFGARCALAALALATLAIATHAAEKPAAQSVSAAALRDARGHTPLHLAALRGDADTLDALLAQGADANASNQAGATPLHYAVASERMVVALLAHGARVDTVAKSGRTPLMSAVARPDSFAVARRLIEAGANVNAIVRGEIGPRANPSVLGLAILSGDRRTVDLLLERKASVNSTGFPPLASAVQAGDVEMVQRLIEKGADVNKGSPNNGGNLNSALFNGETAVAKLLIERGADLNAKSARGYATAPMVFSGYNTGGDASMARLLVAHGVDVNTANEAGETALSFALKDASDNELIRFLRSVGAKEPVAPTPTKTIPSRTVPADAGARADMVRESAQRAISLLQISSTAFLQTKRVREESKCISCHQQSLPAIAFGWALDRGLKVDEPELGRQLAATFALRKEQAALALELGAPTPGATTALGLDADGWKSLRYASDGTAEAMSHYLLGVQRPDGSWRGLTRRVPMEEGSIDATAWSARAIALFPPDGRAADAHHALNRAREWLGQQKTETINDRVFQLLGLAWTDETPSRLRPLVDALLKEQRPDGGWAQMPDLASDAWATGSALVALQKSGLSTHQAAYQRGVDFLLRTQFADGSWWVRSRAWPFQPHFDSKFPHGKDQWISAGATGWATLALLLTIEPSADPVKLPNAQTLIATFLAKEANAAADVVNASAILVANSGAATVDFHRDIRPVLERSCANCHSGAKPKGMFDVTSRVGLLKGGQSGEAAIVPGYAEASPFIKQVSDTIEDLEMPPLDRREKYPALSPEEIARFRAWIDAGAPWPIEKPTKSAALP